MCVLVFFSFTFSPNCTPRAILVSSSLASFDHRLAPTVFFARTSHPRIPFVTQRRTTPPGFFFGLPLPRLPLSPLSPSQGLLDHEQGYYRFRRRKRIKQSTILGNISGTQNCRCIVDDFYQKKTLRVGYIYNIALFTLTLDILCVVLGTRDLSTMFLNELPDDTTTPRSKSQIIILSVVGSLI